MIIIFEKFQFAHRKTLFLKLIKLKKSKIQIFEIKNKNFLCITKKIDF